MPGIDGDLCKDACKNCLTSCLENSFQDITITPKSLPDLGPWECRFFEVVGFTIENNITQKNIEISLDGEINIDKTPCVDFNTLLLSSAEQISMYKNAYSPPYGMGINEFDEFISRKKICVDEYGACDTKYKKHVCSNMKNILDSVFTIIYLKLIEIEDMWVSKRDGLQKTLENHKQVHTNIIKCFYFDMPKKHTLFTSTTSEQQPKENTYIKTDKSFPYVSSVVYRCDYAFPFTKPLINDSANLVHSTLNHIYQLQDEVATLMADIEKTRALESKKEKSLFYCLDCLKKLSIN